VNETFKPNKSDETSELEGSIAMFFACHCAISNCDHLIDLLKNNIPDCKVVSGAKMHRTKCSNIIKNILCARLIFTLLGPSAQSVLFIVQPSF
jgi:hypothetical protein